VAVLAVWLSACGASLGSGSTALSEPGEPKLGATSVGDGASDAHVVKPLAATKVAAGGPDIAPSKAPVAANVDRFVAASAPGNTAYKVGSQDVLEFSVFQVPELTKASQVNDNGSVNLPLVGEIQAAGLTAQDIERDLTKRLKAKYLQNPQVTVFVKEFNSQRVTVEGAVKKQGVYPLRGKTSLLQSIAMAEGLDAGADSSVVVFRMTEKGRTAARFDMAEIRSGIAEDPLLRAGDVVVVGSSFWKEHFGNFVKLLPLVGVFALL
jgi:polysaccharide biosynthesis/export protein